MTKRSTSFSRFRFFLIFGLSVFQLGGSARAQTFNLTDIRLGAIGAYHPGAGSNWFAQLSWTPSVDFELFSVRGELGWTALRNGRGARVGVTNVEVLASLPLTDWIRFEAGGGTQTWGGGTGTHPSLGAGLTFGDFYVGYCHVFAAGGINEYRVGRRFELF